MIFRRQPMAGHCWRAAIACLLDLDPLEVPHYKGLDKFIGRDPGDGVMYSATRRWLNARGLMMIQTWLWVRPEWYDTPADALEAALAWANGASTDDTGPWPGGNDGLRFLLSGDDRGDPHVVVCEGRRVVWNTNGGPLHLDPRLQADGWAWWKATFVVPISSTCVAGGEGSNLAGAGGISDRVA